MEDDEHPVLQVLAGVTMVPYLVWSTWTAWAILTGGTIPILGWHSDPSLLGALTWLAVGEWLVYLVVFAIPLTLLYFAGVGVVRALRLLSGSRPDDGGV